MINTVDKIDSGWGDSILRSVNPLECINYVEKDDGGQGDS